jgi:acetoin utilization deacetylase AcuC-like enzyme
MQVFYSESHRQHDPPFEVIDGGQRAPYLESPARMDSILAALQKTSWAKIVEPSEFTLDPILAVHAPDYIEFLASAWQQWLAANPEKLQAPADAVLLPATFALRRHPHKPSSLLGRAGYHMMDLSAVIVGGTYLAALASANCALSAAQAISGDGAGNRCAFSLSRPPGHHAGRDYAAGYCFINNAAVAAQSLSSEGKVAVLDVDYHVCNGTQDIFYDRNDVITISIHADPASEYPYYAGYADETGAGEGLGFHRNFPLSAGIDNDEYLAALDGALDLIRRFDPNHLVLSVGMDIYEKDSLGRFKITTGGIHAIGERIAGLGLPTAIIMEGGYNNADLGTNMVSFLSAFNGS